VGLHRGHRKRLRAALLGTSALVGASLAATAPLQAQSTWQGTTSDYGTPSNWDNNTPPIAAGTANFGSGGLSTINVGTVVTASGWTFLASAQSYNIDGAALQFSNVGSGILVGADSGTITIANTILGGPIQKFGAGTLVLTATGSDLGGSGVAAVAGVLEIRGGSLAGVGTTQIGGAATLSVTQGGSLESAANFIGAGGAVEVTGAGSSWRTVNGLSLGGSGIGTLTVADGGTVTVPTGDAIEIGAGSTLKIGTGGLAGSVVADRIENGGEIIANFTDTSTLDANISGNGTITKNGTGTLILGKPGGTSSYGATGTVSTFVNGGTLSILGSSALGAGDASFANGTTFSLSTGGSYIENNILIAGNVAFSVESGVTSGIGGYDGVNSVYLGNITDGATAGTLIKVGAGTLGLAGENTYTGYTHVREGTLQINEGVSLPATTNVTVNTGATLQIGDPSFNWTSAYVRINSLADGPAGGGTVSIESGSALDIGNSSTPATTTFSGKFSGDGSLGITGGSLTLTGAGSSIGDLLVCECATLTLTGATATLDVTSPLGAEVTGTLNVLNGAKFTAIELSIDGKMVVDGKNTEATVQLTQVLATASGFPASLTISGGARMFSGFTVIESDIPDAPASITVTGAGSKLTTLALGVGAGFSTDGPGQLTVSAGGAVEVSLNTVIGANEPGLGPSIVTVTGAGSSLKTGSLAIGSLCGCYEGTLNIADGAIVTSTNGTEIGSLGILNLGTGGLGGTLLTPTIANDGAIVANFTDVITLAANISGGGTLTKQGPGTLFLTGTSTYTGATSVDGGKLAVNGSITSEVTVNAGGTLGGSGSVGATTINSGGALAPGNSIGTITINGSLTFVGAGNYIVEVSPTNGLADLTNVVGAPGTADIAGTITALGTGYGYKIGSRYTVLNAATSVTGTFATLAASGFGSTTPHVEYFSDHVDLVLDANSLALTGLTPNQRAVANTINTALGQGIQLSAFDVAFNSLLGLDMLSGEVHASTLGVLVDESLYPRQAVLGRLRQASYGGNTSMASLGFGGPQNSYQDEAFETLLAYGKSPVVRKAPMRAPQASSDVVFWAQGFGAWGKFDGDGNATNVRRDLAGVFTGFDTRAGEAGRIGIAAGYTGSKYSLDGRGTATLDTGHVMGYGGWNLGALNLRAGGAFAHHRINTDRTIALPGFFDRAFSSYAGYTGQVFGEAGYGFNMRGVALEAFAGAAWVRVHANGTTERGGDAALNVAASSFEVGYSTLGLRAATIVPLANSMVLVPRVTLAWQHAFGGTTPGVVNAFAAAPALPFLVQGVPIARDSFLAEAGVDIAVTPQMTFGVSYTGQIARNVSDHGAKGKFSWRF